MIPRGGKVKSVSNIISELRNCIAGSVPQLNQTPDYCIGPMVPKFSERYTRGSHIVLKCMGEFDLIGGREFALSVRLGLPLEFDHVGRDDKGHARVNNHQLP